MQLRNYFVLISLALAATGCKSGTSDPVTSAPLATKTEVGKVPAGEPKTSPIVGTWSSSNPDQAGSEATYDFKDDGTYTMKADGPGAGGKGKMSVDVGGTYKMVGDKLSLHIDSTTMSSDDPAQKAVLDEQNTKIAATLKTLPETVLNVKWEGNDAATMVSEPAPNAPSQTFKMKRKS